MRSCSRALNLATGEEVTLFSLATKGLPSPSVAGAPSERSSRASKPLPSERDTPVSVTREVSFLVRSDVDSELSTSLPLLGTLEQSGSKQEGSPLPGSDKALGISAEAASVRGIVGDDPLEVLSDLLLRLLRVPLDMPREKAGVKIFEKKIHFDSLSHQLKVT